LVNQWLVWGGLNIDRSEPLSFVPTPSGFAQGRQPSLNSWIGFPWRGPETILMPGFQSDAGNGLKNQLEGSDLFLTTCGLMAAGTDEILISRWNTGGDLNLQTGREYLQQRKTLSGSQSLAEAKRVAQQAVVKKDSEPKLRLPRGTDESPAKHPVFWSGMLVVQVPTVGTSITQTAGANGAANGSANKPANTVGGNPPAGGASQNGSGSKEGSTTNQGSAGKEGSATNQGSAAKEGSGTILGEGSGSNGSGQKP